MIRLLLLWLLLWLLLLLVISIVGTLNIPRLIRRWRLIDGLRRCCIGRVRRRWRQW